MTKALFINGSPRKNGNTAQLLKRAMDGAREAGAETGLVDLYDHSMNFKGCMSCFACKIKGGRKGVCSFRDDLQPVMEKAADADVLVCGSPVYCGYPTAGLRAFMERLIFPAVNYSDFRSPVINKPKRSASIFTMNCPEEMMSAVGYIPILEENTKIMHEVFGYCETLYAYNTYQFNDYSRYDFTLFDEADKRKYRDEHFSIDLQNAFELGKRLVEKSKVF